MNASNNPNLPRNEGDLPEDLHAISAALDRFASTERASVPAGLEARIAAMSMPRLPSASPQLRLTDRDAVVARAIYQRVGWQMRMAAAVAIAAGLGIAVLGIWGLRSSGTGATGVNPPGAATMAMNNSQTNDDAEFQAMIRGAAVMDSLVQSDQVDAILADAQSLDQSGLGTLLPSDLTTTGEEGGLVQ